MENNRQPGGLFIIGKPDGKVPLHGVNIEAKIVGAAARVTVSQRYRNEEGVPIEAVYTFPLPESAAVCAFEVEIGGKRVVGVVEEREEAFETYDKAMSAGNGAFLADQDRPNVFTMSVGNLLPDQEAVINLSYVTELEQTKDAIRFFLPTTITPKYMPQKQLETIDPVELDHVAPPTVLGGVPYGLKLKVDIECPNEIRQVSCPSHPASITIGGSKASVELMGQDVQLDRDFVLNLTVSDPFRASAVVAPDGKDNVVMLNLFPNAYSEKRQPSEFVFVVDRSGSMDGDSIEQARNALMMALRSMQDGDRFNIIGFGSNFDPMYERSVAYSQQTLSEATVMVSKMQADMGGTEMRGALEYALKGAEKGTRRQIFLITDGGVSNEEELIKEANSKGCRIFTMGVGCGVNEYLLSAMARSTGGKCETTSPNERIEPKVMRQFARMTVGRLSNVRVEWGALKPDLMAPSKPQFVYGGDRFTLYARVKKGVQKTKVTIVAETQDGKEVRFPVTVDLRKPAGDRAIPVLMARKAIQEMEEEPEQDGGSAQKDRKKGQNKAKILELALRYQIMSSETSFVAVEERDPKEQAGRAELRRVPVALTKGWHGTGLSGCTGFSGASGVSGCSGQAGVAAQSVMFCASAYPAAGQVQTPAYTMRSAWSTGASGPVPSSLGPPETGDMMCFCADMGAEQLTSGGIKLNDSAYDPQYYSPLHTPQNWNVPSKRGEGVQALKAMLGATANDPNLTVVTHHAVAQQVPQLDDLVRLLLCQCADGMFEMNDVILEAAGVTREKAQADAASICSEKRLDIVATLLALQVLDDKFSVRAAEWQACAEKARAWLDKNAPGINQKLDWIKKLQ